MSDTSSGLYSPVKKLGFTISVPDLQRENNSSSPQNTNSIPIIITGPAESKYKVNDMSPKQPPTSENRINSFSLDHFSINPWNCLNTTDLSIVQPSDSQVNFNRNVFKALDALKRHQSP